MSISKVYEKINKTISRRLFLKTRTGIISYKRNQQDQGEQKKKMLLISLIEVVIL